MSEPRDGRPQRNIEIHKVANGYLVRPSLGPSMGAKMENIDEVYVFETFEALVVWLREQMG